jgi:hypothetical protein
MKKITVLALMLSFLLPLPALSQTTSGSSKSPKRRPAARSKQPPVDTRAEAAKVAEQLKLLTRFLYLYGKVITGLESVDEQAKRGEVSQELLARTAQSKASLVENIKGLRIGLEKLEQNFQANPRQPQQSLGLVSAPEAVAKAERLAAAGRFDEAGRVLLGVAERLLDFLVDFR